MLLHGIQEHFGYISRQAVEWIAAKLELQPINIYELVTFYPMFHQLPVGKFHFRVCRTLSCALAGSRWPTLRARKRCCRSTPSEGIATACRSATWPSWRRICAVRSPTSSCRREPGRKYLTDS